MVKNRKKNGGFEREKRWLSQVERERELEISCEMKKKMVTVHLSRDNGEPLFDISANQQCPESLSKFFLQTASCYYDVGESTVSKILPKVSARKRLAVY